MSDTGLKWFTEEISSLLASLQLTLSSSLNSFVSSSASSASAASSFASAGDESINLFQLYLNPLYLFPIIFVIFTGLLVYVFGFKSTSSIPPTLHLFVDKDVTLSSASGGNQISKSKSSKPSKKEKKKENTADKQQQQSDDERKVNKAKEQVKLEQSPKEVKKEQKSEKQKTSKKENRKQNADEFEMSAVNNNNDGEWVQIVSRKNKKNLKVSAAANSIGKVEVNAKSEVNSIKAESKKVAESPKVNKKKQKQEKVVKDDAGEKTEKAKVVNEVIKNSIKQNLNEVLNTSNDELMAQVPEYILAKEARVPSAKKASKQAQKGKRNSESEQLNYKSELKSDDQQQVQTDKITAAIIKSYEGDEKQKAKSNNQIKKKKAGKANTANAATNVNGTKIPAVAQVESKDVKAVEAKVSVVKNDIKVEVNRSNQSNTEAVNQKAVKEESDNKKTDDDDGFKIPINRKKRSRRE